MAPKTINPPIIHKTINAALTFLLIVLPFFIGISLFI